MKQKCSLAVAAILALIMLLTLCACGSNSLVGSWYEEESGRLVFQLFKNGECDLYTSGVRSAGKWSVSGDTLRMVTIINNENYTIKSLKGGCLTVTDTFGRTLVLWNSQEKAVSKSSIEEEPAAENTPADFPEFEDKSTARQAETASPGATNTPRPEPTPAPIPTATPVPTPEPVEYYTAFAAQDDLLFAKEDDGSTIAINTDGQLVFTIPDGRQFEKDTYFIGEYALISDGGIIDRQGNVVFELRNTDFDEYAFTRCMDAGYIVCSKDFNTFEFTGTRYYTVNLATGESTELPSDVNKSTTENWYYYGNGFYAIGDWHCDIILDVKNASVHRLYCNSKNGSFYLLSPSEVWIDGNIYHELNCYCDLNTGEIVYTNLPQELYNALGTETIYSWDYSRSEGPLYCFNNQVVYNKSSGAITLMSDYSGYQVLKLFPDGSMFVRVKNSGGGSFLTVVEPDGTRRFEPIPLGDYLYADSCFEVWDDSSDTIYDYTGQVVAQVPNAYTTLGDTAVLCRDHNSGKLSLIDLASGETKEVDLSGSEVIYSGGCYVVQSGTIDGSVILHEDGTIIYLEKGKLELAPVPEQSPDPEKPVSKGVRARASFEG